MESSTVNFSRHLRNAGHLNECQKDDLVLIFESIIDVVKQIANKLRRAGLNEILGYTDSYNVHGDNVSKSDYFTHQLIIDSLSKTGMFCIMASEESEKAIEISDEYPKGKYVLAFDPLDGSTNVDVNSVTASIFSIYERKNPDDISNGSESDICQKGAKQLAAAYAIYGPATQFVYTIGEGAHIFTLDQESKEFILCKENIKMPETGKHYSCNESNFAGWPSGVKKFMTDLKKNIEGDKPYKQRYIATVAADVHRILHYGGVYLYPAIGSEKKSKIRLVYEANALAMIVEQAGGEAIDGQRKLLEIIPQNIHATRPFFVGSKNEIKKLKSYLNSD